MNLLLPILILTLAFISLGQDLEVANSDYIKIKVKSKENISTIAERFGVKPEDLARVNNLNIDAKLKKGSFIIIPSNIFPVQNETKVITAESVQAEQRIKQITNDSGRYFKQGLSNLLDNRRPQAREDFDKSVEVFLMSGINLTSNNNAKARDCYNQLIETVYRMEYPSDKQTPQIRPLAATCGWNVETDLADKVAKLVLTAAVQRTTISDNSLMIASIVPKSNESDDSNVGFSEQKFATSPLDDLAKLTLENEAYLQSFKNRKTLQPKQDIKPYQAKNGKVKAVMDYFNENANDPYSMRFIRWSSVIEKTYRSQTYWTVQVKFRAKNLMGAYVLTEEVFYIKNNKVVATEKIS